MQASKTVYRLIAGVLTLFFLLIGRTYAGLHLELTQGVSSAIPVALIPFSNDSNVVPGNTSLTQMISNDLQNSGEFRVETSDAQANQSAGISDTDMTYWRKQGVNALILGQVVTKSDDTYKVSFQLLNLYEQTANAQNASASDALLLSQSFTVKQAGLRRLAHHISDMIYQKLTGVRGIFSTKIAYVLVQQAPDQKPEYLLNVADADGFNAQTLLRSSQPIMSPTWTPDGSGLAYVSFEGHRASIYLQQLATAKRELISSFPGINGAPAFSPDGQQMALVLSTTGNPKIYTLDLKTRKLTQITHGYAIDTEPVWSEDGQSLYFTSNRAGGPQIYQYDFKTGQVSRVTFDGNYNARACLTPQAKSLVMMHREDGVFGIAKLNLSSGRTTVLTASGADDSPSLAPNGKMVLYGTQFASRSVLGVVSIDGRVKLRLPSQAGDVQDPAWSPYLG